MGSLANLILLISKQFILLTVTLNTHGLNSIKILHPYLRNTCQLSNPLTSFAVQPETPSYI